MLDFTMERHIKVSREIWALPAGTVFSAHYLFGGDVDYIIQEKQGRKRIIPLEPEHILHGRGWRITGPASIRNTIGLVERINVKEAGD